VARPRMGWSRDACMTLRGPASGRACHHVAAARHCAPGQCACGKPAQLCTCTLRSLSNWAASPLDPNYRSRQGAGGGTVTSQLSGSIYVASKSMNKGFSPPGYAAWCAIRAMGSHPTPTMVG
jgi:hypothetical protein